MLRSSTPPWCSFWSRSSAPGHAGRVGCTSLLTPSWCSTKCRPLPIKCVHLFNNAVNFLVEQCNSTVVLCTATQPLLDRVAPEKGAIRLAPEHELMPDTKALFETLKRVEVRDRRKPRGWSDGEVAELALDETRRTGSCLVIVNTKRAARAVYKICSQRLKKEEVSHLSTDMCPTHRKNTLGSKRDPSANTVIGRLERGVPILCVSTQLIEAGIDVDFGAVRPGLAPDLTRSPRPRAAATATEIPRPAPCTW